MSKSEIAPISGFQSTNLNSRMDNFNELSDRILRSLGYPFINVELHRDQIYENISIALEYFSKFAGYTKEYLMFDSNLYKKDHGINLADLFTLQNTDTFKEQKDLKTFNKDFTKLIDMSETTFAATSAIKAIYFDPAYVLGNFIPHYMYDSTGLSYYSGTYEEHRAQQDLGYVHISTLSTVYTDTVSTYTDGKYRGNGTALIYETETFLGGLTGYMKVEPTSTNQDTYFASFGTPVISDDNFWRPEAHKSYLVTGKLFVSKFNNVVDGIVIKNLDNNNGDNISAYILPPKSQWSDFRFVTYANGFSAGDIPAPHFNFSFTDGSTTNISNTNGASLNDFVAFKDIQVKEIKGKFVSGNTTYAQSEGGSGDVPYIPPSGDESEGDDSGSGPYSEESEDMGDSGGSGGGSGGGGGY